MNNLNKLEHLKRLQADADAIRRELGISQAGTILYQSHRWNDSQVLVEADGLGGATVSVVEGNYPIDYVTSFEKPFSTEHAAEIAVVSGEISKEDI